MFILWCLLLFFVFQNPREDSLVPNVMVTPHKPGSCIENALHKDVFGVISGTGSSFVYVSSALLSITITPNPTNLLCFPAASPHSSTPNVSSVHHADSRGSLVSTDSGNSLLDKSSDRTNSLEKVYIHIYYSLITVLTNPDAFYKMLSTLVYVPQRSHTTAPCLKTHHREKLRRHSVNVPPLPLDPDDPTPNRASKRVTMDFSLLSVPLFDKDSDLEKPGPNGQGNAGNPPIQVLTDWVFPLCCERPFGDCTQASNFGFIWLMQKSVQCTQNPSSSSSMSHIRERVLALTFCLRSFKVTVTISF